MADEYLLLFSTHLNASYMSDDIEEVYTSVEARTHHVEVIRDFINLKVDDHKQRYPGQKPLVVLAGDLNINSNERHDLK